MKKANRKTKNNLIAKFEMAAVASDSELEISNVILSEEKPEAVSKLDIDSHDPIFIEEDGKHVSEIPVAIYLAGDKTSFLQTIIKQLKNVFISRFRTSHNVRSDESFFSPPMKKGIKDYVVEAYVSDLKTIFPMNVSVSEVDAGQFYNKDLLNVLSHATEVILFLQKKMKFYQLESGVSRVQISTTIENKTISQILEFELVNSMSTSWIMMFTKNIIPDVLKSLEKLDGTISGHHHVNLSKNTNCFTLIFSHRKLEEEIKSLNQKTHTDLYTRATVEI